jgi:MSHA biogenesis protein MshM
MYKELLNLSKWPFENVPDPEFFFNRGGHARAFQSISSSIDVGRGLMVVGGPIGSGKTTLSQMIMKVYGKRLNLIWMAEPPDNGMDLLTYLGRELGISPVDESRIFLIDEIRSALLASESRCLLIIDEAHLMLDEVAGTLKTLNNLELMSKKLIQILLLGQEELIVFINKPEMASFKQRIATLEVIGRMERREIKDYIQHRLDTAGGKPDTFTEVALEAIALGSGGVPRLINTLSDKALFYASSKGSKIADVEDVYDAAQGLIDRKEIFHMMLRIKNRAREDENKSSSNFSSEISDPEEGPAKFSGDANESSNDARSQAEPLSSLQALFAPPEESDAWMGYGDKKKAWPIRFFIFSCHQLLLQRVYTISSMNRVTILSVYSTPFLSDPL